MKKRDAEPCVSFLSMKKTGMISPGLGMPIWIYGSFCLIGFVIMFLSFTEIAVNTVKQLAKKDHSGKEAEK